MMKRLAHAGLLMAAFVLLGWTLWRGLTWHASREEAGSSPDEAAAASSAPATEERAVSLTKEEEEALAIETAELQPLASVRRLRGWGRVLDPEPLAAAEGDLRAAESALKASAAENERAGKLLAAGESVSRKAAETAEAQYRADESKTENLRRSLVRQGGADFAALDVSARRVLLDRLARAEAALVRIDLTPGEELHAQPKRALLSAPGDDAKPIVGTRLSPAVDVDPRTQALGFLLLVEESPFPLRPGQALGAWLEADEKPRPGFAVPASALLREEGGVWVYVKRGGVFHRLPVPRAELLPEEANRWLIPAAEGSLETGDRLVVTGAAALLGAELKSEGGGAD